MKDFRYPEEVKEARNQCMLDINILQRQIGYTRARLEEAKQDKDEAYQRVMVACWLSDLRRYERLVFSKRKVNV